MDEGPNPGENEELGARLGRFSLSELKKKAVGGLAGSMARDALTITTCRRSRNNRTKLGQCQSYVFFDKETELQRQTSYVVCLKTFFNGGKSFTLNFFHTGYPFPLLQRKYKVFYTTTHAA
jgi:hypothetical protein